VRTGPDGTAATVTATRYDMGPVVTESADELQHALEQAMAGREHGFTVLYRHLQPRMLRYASALIGRSDADDVTAEMWFHVSRDLARFSGDIDGFRGWVATICRNRAMDLARSRARRPQPLREFEVALESPADVDTGEQAFETLSTRDALGLINTLPRHQAEVVLLRSVIGLDAATAGAVLGRSAGAVRVAAHRGLRRLAEVLGDA
jgi:RNA polymerase sigma-70 factor (ECF subfamily)